jgi:hypothetical protein
VDGQNRNPGAHFILLFFLKFSNPLRWFYFFLHITFTIASCNSLTSEVDGSLLYRLSE